MTDTTFDPVDVDALADVPAEDIFAPDELPAVPPPYTSPFGILKHTWTGTDGSVWHLDDPNTGAFIVQEDLEGMHLPLTDDINRESPSLAGATFHGYRVKPRDVVWSIYLYSDESSEAFYDMDRRFWDSMKIGQYGTWRVTRPDGAFRELTMRQVPTAYSFPRDPGRFGWAKYPVRFIADTDPFWRTPLLVPGSRATATSDVGDDFFGADAGVGTPFYISPSAAETVQEIYNDGDEDVWAKYTVTGPMDFVDFTVKGRDYHLECDLLVGETLTIDTRPESFKILDGEGENRIHSIDDWRFDSYKSKETTKITVYPQGLGGGSFMIDASPLYHRAW